MISLSKQSMEEAFAAFCEKIFCHPEVDTILVKGIVIQRDDLQVSARKALEAGYHDCYSDVDLKIKVILPADGSIQPDTYMNRIDRFGIDEDTALGWFFVPENSMYRIVFKNGMRYDFGFEFEYTENAVVDLGDQIEYEDKNVSWPRENINRFWFVQIQALGKLYRKDYLISSHLANMNCNETLVMQMVLRDLQYGTNHHRYGYSESLEYVKDLGKCPYRTDDPTFDRIADHLYAAALTYDRLAKQFYPGYCGRFEDFIAIWNCYERNTKL